MSRRWVTLPFGSVATTMSSNCAGVESRPSVWTAIWKRAGRFRRRLIDGAGRDLDIGGLQRRDGVAGREAADLQLRRIEPYAHRIVAGAEHDGVADAVDAGDDVLDVDRGVVRNVLLIERPVGRDQMDDQHQVRRFLANGHADVLHLLGQSRQRDRDAILHQHLRLIDVGAGLEDDVDRQRAVAGRLRNQVDHVVDAVDLLLDRRRDGLRRPPRRTRRQTWPSPPRWAARSPDTR